MEAIAKGIVSGLVAYTAHYGSLKLYDKFCVPDGILGYLQGMVTMGSPMCQAGVQVIQHTQITYSTAIMMGLTRLAIDLIVPGVTGKN